MVTPRAARVRSSKDRSTATSAPAALHEQDRQRIDNLETTVSRLRDALGFVVQEIARNGIVIRSVPGIQLLKHFKPANPGRPAKLKDGRPRYIIKKISKLAPAGLEAALARGEAARIAWVQDGEVVPAKDLAGRWGLTPQALGPAAARGEVFSLTLQRQRYYPREFLDLERSTVASVCRPMAHVSPAEQLVFWKRPHGALGGKKVAEALAGPEAATQLPRIVQLAQSWATEADGAASA